MMRPGNSRREFLDTIARLALTGAAASSLAVSRPAKGQAAPSGEHFDLVVIGTGFGGAMTSLTIAYRMDAKLAGSPPPKPLRILLLERGTWWTTPLETVQDKNVATRDFLSFHGQPYQEWTSLNDARGVADILFRCRRTPSQPKGLYDFNLIGKSGLLFNSHDGVSVLRASGVGGGSLVYSNITIRPPETLFDDPRWPGGWRGAAGGARRIQYYRLAADSIARSVESVAKPGGALVNTGLSNIVTRSARIAPSWQSVNDPSIPAIPTSDPVRPMRLLYQIRAGDEPKTLQPPELELIDRARVFQTAISKITDHYGTVDLAINDIPPEPGARDPKTDIGKNYCERQGRCNIGCLPGARHTLNKQLMRALYGAFAANKFDPQHPAQSPCVMKSVNLELRALAEVDLIAAAPVGYTITYTQRKGDDGSVLEKKSINASRVIVAAGTLGTSELMLRCRESGLPQLSDKVGFGFSTNGDHIAFLENTRDRVSLTRGPVTTSFGQFNADSPNASQFHQVEDQGIPRSLAALVEFGGGVLQSLVRCDNVFALWRALLHATTAFLRNEIVNLKGRRPKSEDELTANMMCVVAQGKDDANGRFWLDGAKLRMSRTDGKRYHEDGVYKRISDSLDRLAPKLLPAGRTGKFLSPLFGSDPVVLTSHPLGGCPMAEDVATGVVDEWGRVFRKGGGFYRGLYIADGSVVPTGLGVNPSLTIAAIALHTADKVLDEWSEIPMAGSTGAAAMGCAPAV